MSSLLMKPTERTGEMMMFVTERHERHDPSSPAVFFIIPPFPVRAFLCNSESMPKCKRWAETGVCIALIAVKTAMALPPPPLQLRGGGSASSEVWRRNVEKLDGDLFVLTGPVSRRASRNFLFRNMSDAERVSNSTATFFIKVPGSVLNPGNWATMLRFACGGAPQRTIGITAMNKDDSQEGPLVMIDGADDIASALQGSGLPQNLANALQAFVLYPLVLPIVELGFRGACPPSLAPSLATPARDRKRSM